MSFYIYSHNLLCLKKKKKKKKKKLPQERDIGDEYGWKQVHGDVFRAPAHALWFSTLVGVGYQLSTVALAVILIAILGDLYTG